MGPALPAGCDTRFQQACVAVEQRLQAGDFDAAKAAVALLPSASVKVAWDDAAAPAASREEFAKARDAAFQAWRKALPALRISLGEPAAIHFSFAESLPKGPVALRPPGATHTLNDSPNPRLTSVIACLRESRAVPATGKDVENEVGYALGLYLGLTPSTLYSHIMGRTDHRNPIVSKITADERSWAAANLHAAQVLRNACAARLRLVPAKAEVHVEGPIPALAKALQGDTKVFKFVVSAKGNVALNCKVASTCECLAVESGGAILPGTKRVFKALLDTTPFAGLLEERLYLYSNDPANPMIEIPLRCRIRPRYRFLQPSGNVVLVDKGVTKFDVYLVLPPDADLDPMAYALQGVDGTVASKPWSGMLPDPDLNEGPMARSGYKLTVTVPETPVYGRRVANIVVSTDNGAFPRLTCAFFLQRGIIASPEQAYFGSQMSSQPIETTVVVSRPGRPFRITEVRCDNPCLTVAPEREQDAQYLLHVRYDGTAKPGPFTGMIEVHTDDPKQPIVKVPVVGAVK